MTDHEPGAALASALMAANYGGDSGEDVDRLIAELAKRGYGLRALGASEPAGERETLVCDDGNVPPLDHPAADVHLSSFARMDKEPDPEDRFWCKNCGATWRRKDRDAALAASTSEPSAPQDPARDPLAAALHREAVWDEGGYHPGYGKGVCEFDGLPWPCRYRSPASERVLRILNDSGSYESMEAVRDGILAAIRDTPATTPDDLRAVREAGIAIGLEDLPANHGGTMLDSLLMAYRALTNKPGRTEP
jgi:hypothetical protein